MQRNWSSVIGILEGNQFFKKTIMIKKISDGYTNKYVNFSKQKILKWILQYPIGGLASHWLFQGTFNMDRSERIYKFGLDLFFTIITFGALSKISHWPIAIVASIFLSHSLNFLFNAQLWVVLKHYGFVNIKYKDYELYKNTLSIRLKKQTSFLYGALHGSLVRGKWRQSSDLDVLLVRKKGMINALSACFFASRERTYAFFSCFPLDIYVLDSYETLIQKVGEQHSYFIFQKG
jgi:hypothetical protein